MSVETEMMDRSGCVYVLTNPSMPGCVKIGMTTRNVGQRIKELSSSTSAPTPFALAFKANVRNPRAVERALHRKFRARRINMRREFFRVSPEEARQAIGHVVDEHGGLSRHARIAAFFSRPRPAASGDRRSKGKQAASVVSRELTRLILRGILGGLKR